MEIRFTASTIAFYGAIVGSLSLLIHFIAAIRDRSRIILTVRENLEIIGPQNLYDSSKIYVEIIVANRGRRPVTINSVGLEGKKGKTERRYIQAGDSIMQGPKEIGEGKRASYIMEQEGINWSEIKCVMAEDETGRKYKRKISRALK